jgi:hypothetical protein
MQRLQAFIQRNNRMMLSGCVFFLAGLLMQIVIIILSFFWSPEQFGLPKTTPDLFILATVLTVLPFIGYVAFFTFALLYINTPHQIHFFLLAEPWFYHLLGMAITNIGMILLMVGGSASKRIKGRITANINKSGAAVGRHTAKPFREKGAKEIIRILILGFSTIVMLVIIGSVGYIVFMDVTGIGTKPIHRAAERGDLPEIQRLIEGGASIDRPTADGRTPLSMALYNNKKEVAFYLIERGANAEGVINLAVWTGDINLVKAIVTRGEKIRPDSLLYVVSHNPLARYPEFLDYLLNNGADINAHEGSGESHPGFTALHIAVWQRDINLIEYLLSKGADINSQDKDGKTPLNLAESSHRHYSNTKPVN